VAGSGWIENTMRRNGMKWGVSRFVAAESLGETIGKVDAMNREGLLCTLDYLGENVKDRQTAEQSAHVVLQALDAIRENGLQSHVSVKLTQLGLLIDSAFCLSLMEAIAAKAKETGSFIRIDMEDSSITEHTLLLFEKLAASFGTDSIGTVLQSCLFRSCEDVERLGRIGSNLRIVKGAYREPPEIAYRTKKQVNESYLRLVCFHLSGGHYTAVATHDPTLIEAVQRFTAAHGIPPERYEFQMLYGIAGGLQRKLVDEGCRVRIYTPFGREWYPYFTRRIAERPANLAFVLKGMFR